MSNVIIMGAGPAGLAAGLELARNNVEVDIFESNDQVGGLSKTVNFNGYYFDIGGHRFFSHSDAVNELWHDVLNDNFIKTPRISRIFYNSKYFNYPISIFNTLYNLGLLESVRILGSYTKSKLLPTKPETTFEAWVSNRFGNRLYKTFFKTYTEKVWGIPCNELQSEWAAQRIKDLSLIKAVLNALGLKKNIKTLIEEFYYPKCGPGMMYENMKERIISLGGKVHINTEVIGINHKNNIITSINCKENNGNVKTYEGNQFVSTIPITDLVKLLSPRLDDKILLASQSLKYRGFISVCVIINRDDLFPDNWLYIHSPEVKVGRIQNFKNWSKSMIPVDKRTSLGLEYFCTEGDNFWKLDDEEIKRIAVNELSTLGICMPDEISDCFVLRESKAYPVYDSEYKKNIKIVKDKLSTFDNINLSGRNGLFRYNNMDHSILTGLYAARNTMAGKRIFNTWDVNTDAEFIEN